MTNIATANVAAYLDSWGLELASRQNRVRNLIGDAHWLSDGHHKETILRDFLARYLPPEAECTTGFVRSVGPNELCSPEIDILIFNRRLHVPYFSEGSLSIVDPSSVLANLEIKSSFSSATIRDSLENVARTRSLVKSSSTNFDLWSGIVFFDVPDSRTLESVLDTIHEAIESRASTIDDLPAVISSSPTCIVLGQNFLAFITSDQGDLRLRGYEGTGLAFASAVCDLLSSITVQVGGHLRSGLEEWASGGDFRMVEKRIHSSKGE